MNRRWLLVVRVASGLAVIPPGVLVLASAIGLFPLGLIPAAGGKKPDCNSADLIDGVLASGQKNGYVFQFTPGPAVKNPRPGCPPGLESYAVTARPGKYEITGSRNYFTDETGVIRSTDEDRPATAQDPPVAQEPASCRPLTPQESLRRRTIPYLEELLSLLSVPEPYWRKARATNLTERAFRQVRR